MASRAAAAWLSCYRFTRRLGKSPACLNQKNNCEVTQMDTIAWNRFLTAARLGIPDQVPVALIVDSPWLPGYAGIDTRDYFLFPEQWLQINLDLLKRFPEAVWIPGFWAEFGMAAEPSAFGCKMRFYPDRPPSIEPLIPDLDFWIRALPINPAED